LSTGSVEAADIRAGGRLPRPWTGMGSQRHQPLCGIPEQRADADRILQVVGALGCRIEGP